MTGPTPDPVVIRHIRDPLWTKPAIVEPSDSLLVVVDLPHSTCERTNVTLRSSLVDRPLEVEGIDVVDEGRYRRLSAAIPADLAPGLYDLSLEWIGGTDVMPSCVSVIEGSTDSFEFVHMADPHVSAALRSEPGAAFERVVEQVNTLNPAFVLLTGDLASRYGRDDEILSAPRTDADMCRAQRIMRKLEVPLFLSAGNHDLAFPWLRSAYRRLMGAPLTGETLDYAFSYGDVRFVSYEAFRYYDDSPPGETDVAPTAAQLEYLHEELAEAQSASSRVLFYHYDWLDEITPLFDRYNVDLALYGHSSPMMKQAIGTTPTIEIMEDNVLDRGHFRLVSIDNGEITRLPHFNPDVVPDGIAIEREFAEPNDGSCDHNHAVVRNHTEHEFTDARVRFYLQSGTYEPSAGRIGRSGSIDPEGTVCEVLVNVPPHSSRQIEIERTAP